MLSRCISLAGIIVLIGLAWLIGRARRPAAWRVIWWGTGLQLALALLVFKAPGSRRFFEILNDLVIRLVQTAQAGSKFVFGSLGGSDCPVGFILAFQALPVIIFFSALMGLLYYWRVMPWLIRMFAAVFTRLMRVSGAESLCVASNIFVGIESVTAVRPYLDRMTRSELCTILTAGMATVASSMLGLYVMLLKDVLPGIAGHLISASIISAPAALVMSKLLLPERQTPETLGTRVPLEPSADASALDAVVGGAQAGMQLVFGICALLIAFLSLLAVGDWLLGWLGRAAGLTLTLEGVLGRVFTPLALVIGVPPEDAVLAGKLFGMRLVATEVPAYQALAEALRTGALAHPRSGVIIAYALCGFAHVASMAIFVGGIAALAPARRADVVAAGPRALLAATLACLMTGAVAGACY